MESSVSREKRVSRDRIEIMVYGNGFMGDLVSHRHSLEISILVYGSSKVRAFRLVHLYPITRHNCKALSSPDTNLQRQTIVICSTGRTATCHLVYIIRGFICADTFYSQPKTDTIYSSHGMPSSKVAKIRYVWRCC